MKVSPVAKAVAAAIGVLSVVVGGVVADDVVNASEGAELVTQLVLAAVAVYGVWKTKNKPAETEPEVEEFDAHEDPYIL